MFPRQLLSKIDILSYLLHLILLQFANITNMDLMREIIVKKLHSRSSNQIEQIETLFVRLSKSTTYWTVDNILLPSSFLLKGLVRSCRYVMWNDGPSYVRWSGWTTKHELISPNRIKYHPSLWFADKANKPHVPNCSSSGYDLMDRLLYWCTLIGSPYSGHQGIWKMICELFLWSVIP